MRTLSRPYVVVFLALFFVAQTFVGLAAEADTNAKANTDQATEEPFVTAIDVEGLQSISKSVVLAEIKNTKVGDRLDPEQVREDLKAILEIGRFTDVEARLTPEDDGVKVIFLVNENPVVTGFNIETEVLEPGVIRKYFSQKEGEILDASKMQEDLNSLQDRVIDDHGFVVRPVAVNMTQAGVVDIKLAATKIADITLKGNAKTRDKVVRRELTVKVGDYLNMNRLRRDLQRIWHLGFFDEVQPNFLQAGGPDAVNLEIEVEERKTGSAAFGAGYSTLDGVLGYLEYNDDNFLGRGERLTVRTEFGQKKTSYDLSFYEPYLMGSNTSFGTNLYDRAYDRTQIENNQEIEYSENRRGGDISVGRPLGEYTKGRITLKIEDSDIVPAVAETIEESHNRTRSVIFQSYTDTTDHPFYPLMGMRANLSVESAGLFLGGDTVFTKYVGETSRYFKVGRADQVLAFRAVGGVAAGELPMQEEFRVGGAETVRGYRYGEMRGDRMLYANGEYRFKMSKMLQAALFVDAGQAWNSNEGGIPRLKVGFGAGLRLDTPLGIMRLDYGVGEKGGGTFFSIGPSF
jgi:outer membrane protein insertion porin family